jgi:catechol-2,3-dioxygenase
MLRNPESINWGLNEVALLRVIDDQESKPDKVSTPPLTHVAFLWESNRRIDVVFAELEVLYPETLTSE